MAVEAKATIEDFDLDASEEARYLVHALMVNKPVGVIRRMVEAKPALARVCLPLPENHTLRDCRLLAIHVACITRCRDETILYLANVFPRGLAVEAQSDSYGLPIQLYLFEKRKDASSHVVKGLVDGYPTSAKERLRNGATLLELALKMSNDQVVQYLVTNHLNPQHLKVPVQTGSGRYPLHLAASRSCISCETLDAITAAYPQAMFASGTVSAAECCSSYNKMLVLLRVSPLQILALPKGHFQDQSEDIIKRKITARQMVDASSTVLDVVASRLCIPDEVMEFIWKFLVPDIVGIPYNYGSARGKEKNT